MSFALIYSPPEQVLNCPELINATTDIYSLAITLYELLTRKVPFSNPHPTLLMHLQLVQALPKHRNIPDLLFEILQRATAKYSFQRPPAQLLFPNRFFLM